MQIRLQQSHHIELHILYNPQHPLLTVVPLIVDAEMYRPDARAHDACLGAERRRRGAWEAVGSCAEREEREEREES